MQVLSRGVSSVPYINADGIFGSRTEQAVIAAQRYFGLTPNGVVGPLLWYAIAEYYYYNV